MPKNIEEAGKNLDRYGYCLDNGIAHFLRSDFEKAAAYHEEIARSLHDLQRMKDNRLRAEEAVDILQRIKARDKEEYGISRYYQ